MLDSITPVILTFNEAPNIGRVLKRLQWAKRVLLVDSFSADETLAIARSFPNVQVVQRAFESYSAQWTFGLSLLDTEWVLCLDADYILPPQLIEELRQIVPTDAVAGYSASFQYCIEGRPLRGSLYPPRVVLFRKARGDYVEDGHKQVLRVRGACGSLETAILHDDRKPLAQWLRAQDRYSDLELDKLMSSAPSALRRRDRLRRLGWLAPIIVPAYCLFARGLILDGRAGFAYTLQRTYYELLLALKLCHHRLSAAEFAPSSDAAQERNPTRETQ
jgi:glycosyltransferase involved in cell wall biosynthesis